MPTSQGACRPYLRADLENSKSLNYCNIHRDIEEEVDRRGRGEEQ